MSLVLKDLIKNYVAAMHDRNAALFVGAGMSKSAGYVDWNSLMLECAQEIGLDLKREHDLVAVAQYYLNKHRNRSRLNQIMVQEFSKEATRTTNHEIISRLPIDTVWTTNFDTLLETAYGDFGKRVDVKSDESKLATVVPERSVVLYKMHGDIATPKEIVICKEDYENYARKHTVFQNTLEGHLVEKTFLFIGFSFTDPNLEYMLGHLRSLLGESGKQHYAVMRRHNRADYPDGAEGEENYRYDLNKQQLQVDDLQRYHIQTLLIDDYADVTRVLSEIEQSYYLRNVFVSGSAHQFGRLGENGINDLCQKLGQGIIERGFNLISGFGLGIGSPVIMGALSSLYSRGATTHLERRLTLRPFPQTVPALQRKAFYTTYRREMLSGSGFAVFIAGNRTDAQIAPGVMEEYEIAMELGKLPIPIGATGYAAAEIWRKVDQDRASVYRDIVPQDMYNKLNDPDATVDDLVKTTLDIMTLVKESWPTTKR